MRFHTVSKGCQRARFLCQMQYESGPAAINNDGERDKVHLMQMGFYR